MDHLIFRNTRRPRLISEVRDPQSKPATSSVLFTRNYRLLLLILFIGLQIADVVTTNYALRVPGIWEANPLMAIAQAKLGAVWWLPKLVVAGYLCGLALAMRPCWPVIFAISFSGLVVLGNLAQLWLSDEGQLLG